MWPFSKTNNLEESGMFNGFTDWHSHILPGVDDGIPSMDKSLEVLRRYEEKGIRKVWLTPHIMEDYPNTPASLGERFAELQDAYKGPIELRLAAENMLDSLFEERLETRDFLPIGEEGNHLLVETSYMNPPYGFHDMLRETMKAGYFILLAHPERYRYMDEDDYRQLKEMGVKFQTNFASLVGGYGETARKKAEWLLKEGMIDVCGSDIHRLAFFDEMISKKPSKKSASDLIASVAQNPALY
ncbi:MAG: capsular biosynthesis protein [Muribaculaceae bacterium]|nr:capsular biosynthesis protein [Muribaculaceae bacterium]